MPRVMGVVNVTPDSFSDGGHHDTTDAAIAHGLQLLDQLAVDGKRTEAKQRADQRRRRKQGKGAPRHRQQAVHHGARDRVGATTDRVQVVDEIDE